MTKPLVFCGPCGILEEERMSEEVEFLAQFRDDCDLVIRGGCWKGQLYPDKKMVDGKWVATPEEYVGLGTKGAAILGRLGVTHNIDVVTEIMCNEHMDIAALHNIDWAQVGARHMGNLPLLRALRDWHGPVLLKRGMGNTLSDLLGAAAHIEHEENNEVVLCERGVVTHEHGDPRIRWRPDILAVAQLKADNPEYRVVLDCSHSTGRRDLVLPMAKAGMAAGADGLVIEVIKTPSESMTDAAQAVDWRGFEEIMRAIT